MSSGEGGGADALTDVDRLRQENAFLHRKVKYLHSVGTIFRQKIAIIMREAAKQPDGTLKTMFSTAMKDLLSCDALGEKGAADAGAVADVSPQRSRTQAAKEDIRKAHHLCQILQEKNEAKQREIELRRALEDLKTRHEETLSKYQRLIELQSSGALSSGGGQAAPAAPREAELSDQLRLAQQEIERLRASRPRSATPEEPTDASTSLAKQNVFLKARVAKLKDELAAARKTGFDDASRLDENLASLLAAVNQHKQIIASRETSITRLMNEKNLIAKDLIEERKESSLLRARVAGLEDEHRKDKEERELLQASLSKVIPPPPMAEVAVDGADGDTVATLREAKSKLEEQFKAEVSSSRDKDTLISSLSAQLEAYRGRLEAIEVENATKNDQMALADDVQKRISSAVGDLQQSQLTVVVTERMSDISRKIEHLESLELQLRQKEDSLAIAQDELQQHKESEEALRETLLAISSLFAQMPKSVESYEKLVVELEAYKKEVVRCVEHNEVPDAAKLEASIELQCLAAAAARSSARPSVPQNAGEDVAAAF